MDAKVRTFLAKEFATAPNYQAHVLQLWDRYRDLGLSNDDFVAERIVSKGLNPTYFTKKVSSLAYVPWGFQAKP